MARIAKFYERLPKGPAPPIKSSGLLGRYQDRYFGKNPSATRECFWFRVGTGYRILIYRFDSYLACYLQFDGARLWHGILLPSPYVLSFDIVAGNANNCWH